MVPHGPRRSRSILCVRCGLAGLFSDPQRLLFVLRGPRCNLLRVPRIAPQRDLWVALQGPPTRIFVGALQTNQQFLQTPDTHQTTKHKNTLLYFRKASLNGNTRGLGVETADDLAYLQDNGSLIIKTGICLVCVVANTF